MVLPSWCIFHHVSFVLSLNPFRSKISNNLNHMLAFKNFCGKYYRYSNFSIICISVFIMPFSAIWLRIQYFLRIKCVYLTFLYCVSLNYPHIKDWKGVSYFLELNDSENKKYSVYWEKNMGCCVGAAAFLRGSVRCSPTAGWGSCHHQGPRPNCKTGSIYLSHSFSFSCWTPFLSSLSTLCERQTFRASLLPFISERQTSQTISSMNTSK